MKGGDYLAPNALDILKMERPEELFEDEKNIRNEYLKLVKKWHPDSHNNWEEMNKVMAKINLLYEEGLNLIQSRNWRRSGVVRFTCNKQKNHEIHFRLEHVFELGRMYIGNNVVAYEVENEYKDLFYNAQRVIDNFKYANEKMREEMSKYLPVILANFETLDSKLVMVIRKTPDMYLLKDVLDFYEGKLPERHMAWILSSLYNLACYIDYVGLSHNSISLDSYFISPKNHVGALLGGWWYSVPYGARMIGVTEKVYSVMPPFIKDNKCGDLRTDLESIRLLGRELLGDINGSKLLYKGEIPVPLAYWLRGVASESAYEDYSEWMKVLTESFGKRRFVDMNFDDKEFYKRIKKSN